MRSGYADMRSTDDAIAFRPVGYPDADSSPPHAGAWSLLHVASTVSPPLAVVYDHAAEAHVVCAMTKIPPPATTATNTNELYPEIQLSTVWKGSAGAAPATSVFVVHQQHAAKDGDGESVPTLCIVDSATSTLTALNIFPSSAPLPTSAAAASSDSTHVAGPRCTCRFAFTLPAKDAVGVRALSALTSDRHNGHANKPAEILVLEPNGAIAIFSGRERLVDVNLMLNDASHSGGGATADALPAILGLQDAVSNRCTVKLVDGSLLRFHLNMHAISPTVQMCLSGLEALASAPRTTSSGDTISCTAAADLLVQLRRAYLPKWSAGASEWAAFSEACRGLLPASESEDSLGATTAVATTTPSTAAAAAAVTAPSDEASDNDWLALMQSGLHQTANSSLNFACFPAVGTDTGGHDGEAGAGGATPRKQQKGRGWASQELLKCAPHVVCALHLVYVKVHTRHPLLKMARVYRCGERHPLNKGFYLSLSLFRSCSCSHKMPTACWSSSSFLLMCAIFFQ